MDSVLSFIFFLIVGFYLAGLLGRLLLRRWIIRKQKEFEQGGNPFFRTYTWGGGGHSRNAKPKPEGKVTVEQTRMTQKRVSGDVGDYVEYEEIKVRKRNRCGCFRSGTAAKIKIPPGSGCTPTQESRRTQKGNGN